jgi:hypothetical protein
MKSRTALPFVIAGAGAAGHLSGKAANMLRKPLHPHWGRRLILLLGLPLLLLQWLFSPLLSRVLKHFARLRERN